jgi:hypothetical protein
VRRSNLLVLAGIAFFAVGVVIVALLSRDNGGGTSNAAGTVDVLVALDATDAEKVIFGSSTTGVNLYLTRVGDKATASGPTPGRDFFNLFGESPEVANARDN